jgi:hypothetical protein
MHEEQQKVTVPDRRQLSAAVNFFLKQTLPRFGIESCAKAFLLTLDHFFETRSVLGYFWHPVHEANYRVFLQLNDGVVSRVRQPFPDATAIRLENVREDADDLHLTAHRSLRTFRSDPEALAILERAGCRSAFECHFRYYGRPLFWAIMGVSSSRIAQRAEAEEFLLLFSRCGLVSLHGACIAETEGRDRPRESGTTNLSLTLQWFHSILRHLNLGMLSLQTGDTTEAESALERASTVASLCLAQILWLMRETTTFLPTETASQEAIVVDR